jgi:hypothetical protein
MSHVGRLKLDPERVRVLAGRTFEEGFAAGVPQLVELADPRSVVLVSGHSEVDALKGLVREGIAVLYAAADENKSSE